MTDKILDQAIAQYRRKLSLPQYAEYLNHPAALDVLMRDCIREQAVQTAFAAIMKGELA